ncbi:hypothetical protein L1O03_03165 [Corynebacterium uropygiale]|uniref:Uncharacterized protein n=1 Tax=Corynebacterium uropygiale TaxID=1775911 RepID=A0A9X1QRE5_9CORY|nr:hypothetical protein [Corynebacterium uropygiale]MCF4006179.1 hypothetical protein [Corynebacterium uropygiale]
MDGLSQFLVDLPLWAQAPLVVLLAVLVCVGVASLLLRVIDIINAWLRRGYHNPHGQS